MSTLDTVRAALVALAQAVPDMGQVHPYERYVRSDAKFQELYLVDLPDGSRQLCGWWLRRTATEELPVALGRSVDVHAWQLRGYMALSDEAASELAFDALIEAFRDAVRADPTLGGLCETTSPAPNGPQGVRVADAGPVLFCGVLCHSAVLELTTWSYP